MTLDKKYIDKITNYTKKYIKLHNEFADLEREIAKLLDKKNKLSNKLSSLRRNESILINKIEETYGLELAHNLLNDILKT